MKTAVFPLAFLVLLLVASCGKDAPVQPSSPANTTTSLDYRDSVTGTYSCSQYRLFYMSPDTLENATYQNVSLVITKDSLNAGNIVINHNQSVPLDATNFTVAYNEMNAMNGGSYYGRFYPAGDSVSFSEEGHSNASHSHSDWHGTK